MTVSAESLGSGSVSGGAGTSQSFETASVTAPANSLLALWLTDNDGLTPSVSGLDLSWTQRASVGFNSGHLVLVTAEVGVSEVTGVVSVSYTGAQPYVSYDLDNVYGTEDESLSFGVTSGVATAQSNSQPLPSTAAVTFTSPVLYLFGSALSQSFSATSATPSENPAWTQLSFINGGLGEWNSLETQVSSDGSNSNASADWSFNNPFGESGWGAIGIPVAST